MKIMLIDDDKEILKSIGGSLSLNGIENKGFSNPVEAINAYKAEKYDAVILDLRMPGMSGVDVLKEIRGYNPRAYVIILTGHPELEDTREG